jgi:signal peptidase I
MRRVASLLAGLYVAGGGQFVFGRYRRGLAWFVAELACGTFTVLCIFLAPRLMWLGIPGIVLTRLASIIDGVVGVRRGADGPPLGVGKPLLAWLALAFVGWQVTLMLRAWVVEAFKIPAGSMIPTIEVGDHLFVNKRATAPRRGDVIVFRYPKDPEKDFIKRVVAVGGDTVEVRDAVLVVNGQPVTRRHIDGDCRYQDQTEDGPWEERLCDRWQETLDGVTYDVVFDRARAAPRAFPETKVPLGTYYVLGDNRDNSHDSRYWGTVPAANVKGIPLSIWWSTGPDGVRWRRINQPVR